MKRFISTILSIAIFYASFKNTEAAIKIPPSLYKTIVMIIAIDGDQVYSGSGVIINSTSGLIVTNDHVIYNEKGIPRDLIICYTNSPYSQPDCRATGKIIVSYNSPFDIGFITPDKYIEPNDNKITNIDFNTWLKESTNNNSELYDSASFRDINNSGLPDLNEDIAILGYPGAGESTLTVTNGHVSGFLTSGKNIGQNTVTSIKTDASINHGNSGGAAVDSNLKLIGIPNAFDSEQGKIGFIIPISTVMALLKYTIEKGLIDNSKIYKPNIITTPSTNLPSPQNVYKTYKNTGFKIQFPNTWIITEPTVNEPLPGNATVSFSNVVMSKDTDGKPQWKNEAVTLIIKDSLNGKTFDEYVKKSNSDLVTSIPAFKTSEDKTFKLKKYNAYLYGGAWTNQNNILVMQRLLYINNSDDTVFGIVITYPKSMAKYKLLSNRLFRSFTFTK